MSVRAVQVLHGRALPKLKQMLGVDERNRVPENSTQDNRAQDGKANGKGVNEDEE